MHGPKVEFDPANGKSCTNKNLPCHIQYGTEVMFH